LQAAVDLAAARVTGGAKALVDMLNNDGRTIQRVLREVENDDLRVTLDADAPRKREDNPPPAWKLAAWGRVTHARPTRQRSHRRYRGPPGAGAG
jgi:hypothetical protein